MMSNILIPLALFVCIFQYSSAATSWLVYTGSFDSSCSNPFFYVGYAMGSCFQTSQNTSMYQSCSTNGNSLTVESRVFSTPDCTGSNTTFPITNPFPQISTTCTNLNGFNVQLQCQSDASPSYLSWPGFAQWSGTTFGGDECAATVKASLYAFSPNCVDASTLVQQFPLSAQAVVNGDQIALRVYPTSSTCTGSYKDTVIIDGLNVCQAFNASSLIPPVPHLPNINTDSLNDIHRALGSHIHSTMRNLGVLTASSSNTAYGAPQVSSIPAVSYQETGTVPSSSSSSSSAGLELWQKILIGVGAVVAAFAILSVSFAYAKGLYCFKKKGGTINSPLIDSNTVNSDFSNP